MSGNFKFPSVGDRIGVIVESRDFPGEFMLFVNKVIKVPDDPEPYLVNNDWDEVSKTWRDVWKKLYSWHFSNEEAIMAAKMQNLRVFSYNSQYLPFSIPLHDLVNGNLKEIT